MKLVAFLLLSLLLGSCGNKRKEASSIPEKGVDRLLAQTGVYHKVGQCLLKTLVDPKDINNFSKSYSQYDEEKVLNERCPEGSQVAAVISAYQELNTYINSNNLRVVGMKYVWACYGSCEFSNEPK
jgi:hypothetical protein